MPMKKSKIYLGCPYCWKPLQLIDQKTITIPPDNSLSIKHYTTICEGCIEENWEDEGTDYVSKKDRLFTCRVEINDTNKCLQSFSPMLKQKIIKKRRKKDI